MNIYRKILPIFFLVFLTGCATTTVRKIPAVSLKGPTYHLNNVAYVPLASVIDAYGADYHWDAIAKKLTLYKDDDKVVLAVGSDVALVKGSAEDLPAPVKMHRSVIVLPKEFASSILAGVFIKRYRIVAPERRLLAAVLPTYMIGKVVLDPGHGGKDPGAIGYFNLREKHITLDIAKRLKGYLRDAGIDVILTRGDDRFISLWRRADIANKNNADFFISIHANASRFRSVKGFEVYYLSEAIDDNARALAAAENASLKYESSSFGNRRPSGDLEATLWDIEYSENREESIGLAKYIADRARKKSSIKNRGVKSARFYVLKGAQMPSVLIEVGFISNKQEARRLKANWYRETLAKAIARGILDYKKEYDKTEGFTK